MTTFKEFIDHISHLKGTAYLVGGAVIDYIKSNEIKDWDIEVFNLTIKEIEGALEYLSIPYKIVGNSFSVFKFILEGRDIDLSIPRIEVKTGPGHTGFNVTLDPLMDIKEAARRRDLTINAIYLNLHTDHIVDPFNGLDDLNDGVLRHVDSTSFIEDPLRVLRVMQLLARKGRVVDLFTVNLCRTMEGEFKTLPKERLFEEFEKLLLKSDRPSLGLQFLNECGWLHFFPELSKLIGCPQHPEHHPEGDVWTHTLMVLDQGARLRHLIPEELRLSFMYACLLHDIGKPSTTKEDFTAYGHDKAGEPLAITFLRRITNRKDLLTLVPKLVRYHMRPHNLFNTNASLKAWLRLNNKCRLDLLGYLSWADSSGRLNRDLTPKLLEDNKVVFDVCMGWYNYLPEKVTYLINGKDLIDKGYKPGPVFKTILNEAYDKQLEGLTREEILNLIPSPEEYY